MKWMITGPRQEVWKFGLSFDGGFINNRKTTKAMRIYIPFFQFYLPEINTYILTRSFYDLWHYIQYSQISTVDDLFLAIPPLSLKAKTQTVAYRDYIPRKSPLLSPFPIQARRSKLDSATVRYHALGAYAKSVYLVEIFIGSSTCIVNSSPPCRNLT